MKKNITSQELSKFNLAHEDKKLKSIANAIQKTGIDEATYNTKAKSLDQHIYSVDIRTGKVTNQKASGRCWIFAALNTFRHKLNKEYNLKDFELSQTYTFFYDKLEKSNFFLENIIRTIDEDIDSRIVNFLLSKPQQDGGQWDMLTGLIKKYGVVPQNVMPDVFHSTNSYALNKYLNKILRKAAAEIRGNKEKALEIKEKVLEEVYSFLCVSLGEPPKTFDFEYYDKDNKYHIDSNLTPLEFYDKYVGINLDDYVSIINSPTKDKPYYKTFSVDFLGSVYEANQVKYINLPMEDMKEATIKQLEAGETVWFGSEVGQYVDRKLGILDLDLFEVNSAYDIDFNMSKEIALDYCDSLMTHAMVLSGVNLVDGKPNRWKIENSWGEDTGSKGYYLMTDKWMDFYTYQVVINKKYLPKEYVEKYENETPVLLKAWDPMGALAYMK